MIALPVGLFAVPSAVAPRKKASTIMAKRIKRNQRDQIIHAGYMYIRTYNEHGYAHTRICVYLDATERTIESEEKNNASYGDQDYIQRVGELDNSSFPGNSFIVDFLHADRRNEHGEQVFCDPEFSFRRCDTKKLGAFVDALREAGRREGDETPDLAASIGMGMGWIVAKDEDRRIVKADGSSYNTALTIRDKAREVEIKARVDLATAQREERERLADLEWQAGAPARQAAREARQAERDAREARELAPGGDATALAM